jgi:hypothetical protein
MTTTNGNRKILDMKRWEFCTPAPVATAAGALLSSSRHHNQRQLYWQAVNTLYLYNPYEDGWVQLPSPSFGGTFGAGAAATCAAWSTGTTTGATSLTATAGTTTTITTNQTLARDLNGYCVQFLAGTNAGKLKEIASNTIGTNAVITFTSAEGVAFDNTSVYRLLTPKWFLVNAGTAAATTFKSYDFATNTFQSLAQNPANGSSDGKLVATPSFMDQDFVAFASGTATSGTSTTLQNSAKTWTTSQWVNSQVMITSGTGAGQIRTITANDATSLTVATWTINPSTDSQYKITGNDDYIYWLGNNAVTLYRYVISTNTWSTITPSPTARAASFGGGGSAHWIYGSTDSRWTNESSIINGRRIYSFRGSGQVQLDYYDIALNTWTNDITYSPKTETVATGTKYTYDGGNYLYITKEATGRLFRYDIPNSAVDGVTSVLYTQGTAIVGDTFFDIDYEDGATKIKYLYLLLNTSTVLLRMMVI